MKSLVFATGNTQKFQTAQHVLNSFGISLKQVTAEIDEIQGEDLDHIARDKASKLYDKLACPVLVNDDSWSIVALSGFPGPYMKSVNHWFTADDFVRLLNGVKDRQVILTQLVIYQDESVQKMFKKEVHGTALNRATDYPGPPWSNVYSLTDDGRSAAEVRHEDPAYFGKHLPTVWPDVAKWLNEYLA